MRGRTPTPNETKRLRGNPGRRPLGEDSPQAEPGIPDPPKWLKGVALEHWHEIAPELDERGVLTLADGLALGMLCQSFADWVEANEVIATEGVTYTRTTAAGKVSRTAHPAVRVRSDAFKNLAAMCDRFGMSPSTRERVPTNPRKGESDFERYLRGES